MAEVIFHSAKISHNGACASNVSAIAFNNSQGNSFFTITVSLKQDILKLKTVLVMNQKSANAGDVYDKLLFRTELDSCSAQRGGFALFFYNLIREYLEEFSNLHELCPIPKASYYIRDFGISGAVPWPSFLPKISENLYWETIIDLKAKLAKSKGLVHCASLKIYGTTIF